MKRKAIFVIGGMGPEASGYLYNMLIKLSITDFGAKNNDDFPEVILHSLPVSDFISDDQAKKAALKMLIKAIRQANKLDISYLSIACNTAHLLLKQLQEVANSPFISMIDEVVDAVVKGKFKIAGIVGTPSTLRYRLYQDKLLEKGIKSVTPTEAQMKILEMIIRNVIKGKIGTIDQRRLVSIADSLKQRGAETVILGCTELPLVFPFKYSLPVFNSVQVLAKALLLKYYKQNTIRP